MKRIIGLLGGSFNPAHTGHLHISLAALKKLDLHEVWWLVSPQNPLKSSQGMAEYTQRLASAQLQTAIHPHIRISDLEMRLGTRYTVDTLNKLKKRFPKTRFIWLMGADNLANFHRWRRWREITRLVPIMVFDRSPFSHTALRQKAALALARHRIPGDRLRAIGQATLPAWGIMHLPRHPESGTRIRAERIKRLDK